MGYGVRIRPEAEQESVASLAVGFVNALSVHVVVKMTSTVTVAKRDFVADWRVLRRLAFVCNCDRRRNSRSLNRVRP